MSDEIGNGILVFLDRDLNAAQPALKKGLALALAARLPLTVAVNADNPAMRRVMRLHEGQREDAEDRLRHAWRRRIDELVDDAAGHLDLYKRISLDRDVEDNLRQTVLDCQPVLIVIHTSDSSSLRRHLFTPRDWMLIRHAPGAVLCVHDRPWSAPLRITMAVEPEDGENGLDSAVLRVARHWARSLETEELDAVHVMEFPDETLILVAGEALPEYAANASNIRDYHQRALDHFAERHQVDAGRVHLLEGPISATLTEYCEQHGSDWLVVGTVRRNAFERLLLGATAEALLHHTHNDVLVVKPAGFASDWEPR